MLDDGFSTNPSMLVPVLPLMLRGTIFDKLALAASLPHDLPIIAGSIHTTDRPLTTPAHAVSCFLAKTNVAVNPITHLAGLDLPLVTRFRLNLKDRRHFRSAAGKPDHLTVVRAAWVRAAGWVVVEYVLFGDV